MYLYCCMCVVCIVLYYVCMYLGEHLVQAMPFVPPLPCDKIDNNNNNNYYYYYTYIKILHYY